MAGKPNDPLQQALEEQALEFLRILRKYRQDRENGVPTDADTKFAVKTACVMITNAVKRAATAENSRTNDLTELRLLGSMGGDVPKPKPAARLGS